MYDSTADTLRHIKRVNDLLLDVCGEFMRRAAIHDDTKLQNPEKAVFDEFTPKLAGSTYGSEEYREFLSEMSPVLKHHYQNNSHHPEHYDNGINGMNLFDIMEMLMDWKAATERHDNGNIYKSLDINKSRFEIGPQLWQILKNTIEKMDWPNYK